MSPGATFERVYLALKEQIVSGAFASGHQLEPAHLAVDLVASVTPVRDALHRLVGERLVETPRNDGFRIPLMTEAALRDLYRWNERLLLLALKGPLTVPADARVGEGVAEGHASSPADPAALFLRIARLSPIREHHMAVTNVNDRLGRVRVKEPELFQDCDEEIGAIAQALASSNAAALRRLLAGYHRRRERRAGDLLELLQPAD
jgi:hypothetical protein